MNRIGKREREREKERERDHTGACLSHLCVLPSMLSHILSLQYAVFNFPLPPSFTGMLAYSQGLSGYHHMMSQHHNPYTTATPPVTGAESSLYTPPFTPIKMEYPCGPGPVSSCMQMPSSSYLVPLPPPPASLSMPSTCTGHIVEPSTAYSSSISSTGRSLQDRHMSEVCRVGWVEIGFLKIVT